jgi:hypothetical protein
VIVISSVRLPAMGIGPAGSVTSCRLALLTKVAAPLPASATS